MIEEIGAALRRGENSRHSPARRDRAPTRSTPSMTRSPKPAVFYRFGPVRGAGANADFLFLRRSVRGGGARPALQNPLSADMNVLRPSLLPGLLDSLRHNVSRKNGDVACSKSAAFSRGKVIRIREERRVAVALTGRRWPVFWSGADRDVKYDIYDLKGALEEFLEQYGLRGVSYAPRPAGGALFLESAALLSRQAGGGGDGPAFARVAKAVRPRDGVFLAELNFDLVLSRRVPAKSFKPLPVFLPSAGMPLCWCPKPLARGVIERRQAGQAGEPREDSNCSTCFAGGTCPKARRAWPAPLPIAAPTAL